MKAGFWLLALGYWFLPLTMNLGASKALPTQGAGEEIRLRATVEAVVPLASLSGAVTIAPVDSDPRFALTIRIDSVMPTVPEFRQGAVVIFAIHSPVWLFEGDVTTGRTYDFLLHRRVRGGRVKFSELKVAI